MRRLLPLALAAVLAAAGCAAVPVNASPTPGSTMPASPGAPSGVDAEPSPTTATATASPANCYGSYAEVTTPIAHVVGPYGSKQTTGSAAVALTFDDGPDPVNTARVLDVLRACGVKATFCVVGNKAAANPDVIRQIVAEGHTLCNHSWWHNSQLGTYGPGAIRDDLKRTIDAIHAIVPDVPVSYFRAPGGRWTADYVSVARQLGMTPLDWDVDPWDWNLPKYGTGASMVDHIVTTVQQRVRPGSIILSHDYQKPDTTEAYRILLPWLLARFVLIALPPVPPQ